MDNQSAIEYDLLHIVSNYTDIEVEEMKYLLQEIREALSNYNAGDILEYITKE